MKKGCINKNIALFESKEKQENSGNNEIYKKNEVSQKKAKKKNFIIVKQRKNKNFQLNNYFINNKFQKSNNFISKEFFNFGNYSNFRQYNYNTFPVNLANNLSNFQNNKKTKKKNQVILIINNYINIENPKSEEETKKKENNIESKENKSDSTKNILESPTISTTNSVKIQPNEKLIDKSSIKFVVAKNNSDDNNEIEKLKILNKKRGRKSSKKGKREHSAFDQDNIIRKIQVHYITFIIDFTNDIIKNILNDNKELFFKSINYEFKKTVNHSYLEKLNFYKIGDILKLKISPKIKKFNENINEVIYNKLYNMNNFFKTFFETSYLEMFNEYYYQNEREVDVNGYKIKISEKTKLFNDLLIKNKQSAEKIREIAEEYFVNKKKNPSQIFFIKKI